MRGRLPGRKVGGMGDIRRRLRARWVRAAGPVLPIAAFGAAWIALHAEAGRAGTHTLFQVLALAECTVAVLLRGRKPLGALAGILVVYVLTDLAAIMILPVLLAVASVADQRERRIAAAATLFTAAAVAVTPYLHGDQAGIVTGILPRLSGVILAAGLGAWVRAHRHPAIPGAGPGGILATAL